MNRMKSDAAERPSPRFATTHWSCVLAAGQGSSPEAHAALARLCELYWYPLYAYLRRQGHQAHDAADLIQGFFAHLIEDDALRTATPERGRFRSFLLTILKRHAAKQCRQATTIKRGGGRTVLSIDVDDGERRYRSEPVERWTAEQLFERRWALTILDRTALALRDRYDSEEKTTLFQELKVFLTPSSGAPSHAEIAAKLDMSTDAVKVAVHRLRRRYRDLLAEEVTHTLASDKDLADELTHLMAALQGRA